MRIQGKARHALLPAAWQFSQCVACAIPHSALQQPGKLAAVQSCGEERAAENADCVLMHLCNHHSGVGLQEDDKTAE